MVKIRPFDFQSLISDLPGKKLTLKTIKVEKALIHMKPHPARFNRQRVSNCTALGRVGSMYHKLNALNLPMGSDTVQLWEGRVQSAALWDGYVRVPSCPRSRVPWHVDFRNDTNAAVEGVADDNTDVCCGVDGLGGVCSPHKVREG